MKDLLLRLALGALVVLSAGAAFADVDPPGRVGRLSYIDGVVSFHTADQNRWSPANPFGPSRRRAPRSRSVRPNCASTNRPGWTSSRSTIHARISAWRRAP